MIAVDTNLLIYAHRQGLPEHRGARRAIQHARDHDRGWGIASPCIAEFWSVVTHPACAGGPSTARQAHDFLRSLIVGAGASVWLPQPGFWERLARAAADLKVPGARIFDLQIALIAFENGAGEIWTHAARFSALPGLLVRDPL
ncbi:MAG: PIN domain-containing protein [Acidobacteria bacterium]|nr:PIN domain-containing protein [Acidobacteriota bacterium]